MKLVAWIIIGAALTIVVTTLLCGCHPLKADAVHPVNQSSIR